MPMNPTEPGRARARLERWVTDGLVGVRHCCMCVFEDGQHNPDCPIGNAQSVLADLAAAERDAAVLRELEAWLTAEHEAAMSIISLGDVGGSRLVGQGMESICRAALAKIAALKASR